MAQENAFSKKFKDCALNKNPETETKCSAEKQCMDNIQQIADAVQKDL